MAQKAGQFEAELLALLPRLRRFCFALTGARHDADDLMQATVERVLAKPAPPGAHMEKWTFRVCKNIWIDEIRARKIRAAANIEDEPDASVTDGESEMASRLTLAQVNAAMAQLPHDHRAVIALVAMEGCSYKAASEVLGIPVGTVMSRLSRARRALADILDAGGAARPSLKVAQTGN